MFTLQFQRAPSSKGLPSHELTGRNKGTLARNPLQLGMLQGICPFHFLKKRCMLRDSLGGPREQGPLGLAAKTGFSSRNKENCSAFNVSFNGCVNQPRTKCLLRMGAFLGVRRPPVHGCLIWPNAWLENPIFAETSLDFHARHLQLPPCKWIRPP